MAKHATLSEKIERGDELEAELAEVGSVTRQCLSATVVLSLLTALAARGFFLNLEVPSEIVAVLAFSTTAMFAGTVIAAIWTRAERKRLAAEINSVPNLPASNE